MKKICASSKVKDWPRPHPFFARIMKGAHYDE